MDNGIFHFNKVALITFNVLQIQCIQSKRAIRAKCKKPGILEIFNKKRL